MTDDHHRLEADERERQAGQAATDRSEIVALLFEARDLLHHQGSHVRRTGSDYPPCPGCDLEARIDRALEADDYWPRMTWRKRVKRLVLALLPAKKVVIR